MFLQQIKSFSEAGCRFVRRNRESLISAVFCLLTAILLQAANTESCHDFQPQSSGGVYSGVLAPGRNCEAPALRFRLNEQLQINARAARTGNRNNMLREDSQDAAGMMQEICNVLPFLYSQHLSALCLRSSYQVHSKLTDPVRAGPGVSHD